MDTIGREGQTMEDTALCQEPAEPMDGVMVAEEPENGLPGEEETAGRTYDLTERLAAEFETLAELAPEAGTVEELPDEVLRAAANGLTLTEAYLRFWYAESRRAAEAERQERRNAAASAGSLRDAAIEPAPAQEAFCQSFRAAIR